MPAPNYTDTKEKLIEAIRVSPGSGFREFDIAKAILDVKGQDAIEAQTRRLTIATWVLAIATSALVCATLALVFATLRQ
jgi:hypothetical protein